ncbi:MAG: hypothetical protein ACR2G2_14585 [Pseudonocardia sp.]
MTANRAGLVIDGLTAEYGVPRDDLLSVLESYEEHHVADVLCTELAVMDADNERFDAKVTVLIENVTHHIEEEEQEWFPQVIASERG